MIPLSIELQNFRSFTDSGEIPLDFAPLFCIVGKNGAGKSSIVEGILWALFGKSRENSRNAVPVRTGTDSVRVKFDFEIENRKYEIIRSNGKNGHKISFMQLDTTTNEFISVVQSHRISDIQSAIENVIGANYQGLRLATVFVQNESAIFSTISPSERRKVLAKLLGIERYEIIRKKASRQARDNGASIDSLDSQMNLIKNQLAEISDPTAELEKVRAETNERKSKLKILNDDFRKALTAKNRIDSLAQTKKVHAKSLHSKQMELERLANSHHRLDLQKKSMMRIVDDEEQIVRLKSEYDELTSNMQKLSQIAAERAHLLEKMNFIEQKISAEKSEHNEQINKLKGEISQIELEIERSQKKVEDADIVRKKLAELDVERQIFEELSAKKHRFDELSKTVVRAKAQIDAEKRNIHDRVATLDSQKEKIEDELSRIAELDEKLKTIESEIKKCEQNHKEYEEIRNEISSVDVKISNRNEKLNSIKSALDKQTEQINFVGKKKISNCPLCGSELTGEHKNELIDKLSSEIDSSNGKLDRIKNELKRLQFERDILEKQSKILAKKSDSTRLQNEYRHLSVKITNRDNLRERFDEINGEMQGLKEKLRGGTFAPKWRSILNKTDERIKSLDFRWEAYEQVKKMMEQLSVYEKRWEVISEYINKIKVLRKKLNESYEKLDELQNVSVSIELNDNLLSIKEKLSSLNYDSDEYRRIQKRIGELDGIRQKYFEFIRAKEKLPQITEDIENLNKQSESIRCEIDEIKNEIEKIDNELILKEILEDKINKLQSQIGELENSLAVLNERESTLKADLKTFGNLDAQHRQLNEQLKILKKEVRFYRIVEKILGPMGIQDWLLQGYLRNIETDANETLALLSDNILKVRLVPESDEKLIIHISDDLGERVYESYSGGEEFRIDFSLRLALSRLLANRAGFPLQTLIVDEGFGSQDETGLSKLVDTLYQVQSQFARIIVVTHLTALQNAFPARLEVKKADGNSSVRIVA
ncbi:SMC family ATPase [bacterium]|nr:SMC family ATPase [bacterium]